MQSQCTYDAPSLLAALGSVHPSYKNRVRYIHIDMYKYTQLYENTLDGRERKGMHFIPLHLSYHKHILYHTSHSSPIIYTQTHILHCHTQEIQHTYIHKSPHTNAHNHTHTKIVIGMHIYIYTHY